MNVDLISICEHEFNEIEDNTCMLCGLCSNTLNVEYSYPSTFTSQHIMPRRNTGDILRKKSINFINIINMRSGKQPLRLKDKDKKIIKDVLFFLYKEDFNERKVRDVIKKLRMNKHLNNAYLIFCILKDIPCLRFDIYEPYFEYVYIKMYEEYIKLYPFKYFISSAYILSMLLNEVGIVSKYYFKDINTYHSHNNIYQALRNIINTSYSKFSKSSFSER